MSNLDMISFRLSESMYQLGRIEGAVKALTMSLKINKETCCKVEKVVTDGVEEVMTELEYIRDVIFSEADDRLEAIENAANVEDTSCT